MADQPATIQDVVDAVVDLTRVTLAIHGNFSSKSDAIRKLDELAVPVSRIAAILTMPTKDVSSALAKARRANAKRNQAGGPENGETENG